MKKSLKPTKKTAKASINSAPVEETLAASIPFDGRETPRVYKTSTGSSVRRNSSSTEERSDKYVNIENSITPFVGDNSSISVREAVSLCQKAYYGFPIFRNTIELMVEFSVNNIYFKGGNQKSRDFFAAYCKKIGMKDFSDKFFREYYRSGNVFIYKHDAKMSESDLREITRIYSDGNNISKSAKSLIPIKYVILNPVDIEFVGHLTYSSGNYIKTLNDYEVASLRNARTKEDIQYLESLPKDVQDQIQKGATSVNIPLEPDNIYTIFYKKQDYEPFSVPMGYGVLSDLNWKEELKKMDMALTRTIQQVILLITTGAEPEKGGINYKNIKCFEEIFKNQSVGRVLVADYTTKAEFVIPQIADILDPKKYEIVNQDIQLGLHNILVTNEKFANQSLKIQLFVEKLKQARQTFIDSFLYPEMKRISEILGFKNCPTPYFEEYDLKDEVEFARIYSRLAELGVLTPEETLRAIETGILPTQEDSEASQRKFKDLRDEKLYLPTAVLAQNEKTAQLAGRPQGTKAPQSTKKISPIGASFDINKIKDVAVRASKLEEQINKSIKKKFKLKDIGEEQRKVLDEIAFAIMTNEKIGDWDAKIDEYLNEPKNPNSETLAKVQSIASEHELSEYSSLMLHLTKN